MSDEVQRCPDPKCAHPLIDHGCRRCGCPGLVVVSWGGRLCASCGDAPDEHRCSHYHCRSRPCGA